MKIMLIRHLPTPGNEKRQYIGRTDEDLSEKAVLPQFAYPVPEGVVISPMKRCIQTAKRIWGVDLDGCPVVLEPLMRECDFGQFEGKTYEQLREEPSYIKWLESGGVTAFPGGETQEAFRVRCVEGMIKQVDRLLDQQIRYVAFLVHGGTIMAVMKTFSEEKKDFYDWQVENGSGYLVSVSEGEWKNGNKVLRNAIKLEEKNRNRIEKEIEEELAGKTGEDKGRGKRKC